MTLSDLYTAMKDESVILIEQLQWMTHVWSDLKSFSIDKNSSKSNIPEKL